LNQMHNVMDRSVHLSTWVSDETKQRFSVIASKQGLSESALLKRLIQLMFHTTNLEVGAAVQVQGSAPRGSRVTVRLQADDQLLLRERATARGMPAATYLSVLTRAHLRSHPPLPAEELAALKRSIAELGAIGRNLNQLARATNQGTPAAGPSRDDLKAVLRACEGLRDHVATLLKANLMSWRTDHD
jgi:hypothetical protein